jgi:hypothetical protein
VLDLTEATSCLLVTDDLITEALRPSRDLREPGPRERVFYLLDHMAKIARPAQGAVKILLVLARVANRDWVDGALEVRVEADGSATRIELLVDDGLSLVRIRKPLHMDVPYDEFRAAIERKPGVILPLAPAGAPGPTALRLVTRTDGAR